jgi:hypothetical protein
MFIAESSLEPPARFGGAELILTGTNLVSFRPSEPRLVVLRFRPINMSLLRSKTHFYRKSFFFLAYIAQ